MSRLPCLSISLLGFLILHVLISGVVSSATVTLLNRCNHTVWPGITSNTAIEVPTTSFRLETGQNTTINVPSSWSGRFHGRTQCVEDSFGNFTCLTGDCGSGKLECTGSRSVAPATLAEFSVDAIGGTDIFDISMVDGYNLPIMIAPIGGLNCSRTECRMDVNGVCPSELKISSDGEGVACVHPCTAFADPQSCCTGTYNSPGQCKASQYTNVFKKACPTAYSYVYDDKASTFQCDAANYLIAFCPTPNESNDTRKSGGVCGTDSVTDPKCLYKPGNNTKASGPGNTKASRSGNTMGLGLKIGIAGGVAVSILFLLLLLFICHRQIKIWHNSTSYPKEVEVFIRKYGPSVPKRFSEGFKINKRKWRGIYE
ncbi:thaumatin-like protein 1b [Heracleum sosnowskyi]|uniref:Thaumatin-like protein 1b n=1 Tax=Heracleum sosnowskyi TaxID=360622 RepID=A0AAD8IFK6_9APIA|nr:thaumatin-like protein 1b [Heracleum sosnowskyi]